MNAASEPGAARDLRSIPRVVLSVAAGVVRSVERAIVGDARVRTAQGNAWEAVCADRARAHQREEVRRLVALLAAGQPVGSSPRSSASQTSLVRRPVTRAEPALSAASAGRPAVRSARSARAAGSARSAGSGRRRPERRS
jgi:hypothetical protein